MVSTMSWPLVEERGVAVLPGIAAVEKHDTIRPLGADRLENGGDAVEPAEPSVASGQGCEIQRGQRIGGRRARRDPVEVQKIPAADVWNQTLCFADCEIEGRLPIQHRKQLGVQIGDVNERDIAERSEAQQLVLRETLLREHPRYATRKNGQGGGSHLQQIAPGEHCSGYSDRVLSDDLRSVVVRPGQHHRTGFLGPELELDIWVGGDRRLEIN